MHWIITNWLFVWMAGQIVLTGAAVIVATVTAE